MIVSIIIPVYNSAQFLVPCLDSIRAQSYSDLEVILVNDGSTDDSGKICESVAAQDARFKVLHRQNGGVWAARNTGMDQATGDWIAFVDSDDLLHPDYIKLLLETALSTDSAFAVCNFKPVESQDLPTCTEEKPSFRVLSGDEAIDRLVSGEFIYLTVWAKLFKRSAVEGLRFENVHCEDTEFLSRAFLAVDKACHLDNILYFYLRRPGSESTSKPFQISQITTCRDIMNRYLSIKPKQAIEAAKFCLKLAARFHQNYKGEIIQEIEKAQSDAWDVAYRHAGFSLEKAKAWCSLFHPRLYGVLLKMR